MFKLIPYRIALNQTASEYKGKHSPLTTKPSEANNSFEAVIGFQDIKI
jgi:hypothetical protein